MRSIRIGNFAIWTSAADARAMGATHHARLAGIVPGFHGDDPRRADGAIWIPRSDALNWVEDVVSLVGAAVCESKGIDPTFAFRIGRPIDAPQEAA